VIRGHIGVAAVAPLECRLCEEAGYRKNREMISAKSGPIKYRHVRNNFLCGFIGSSMSRRGAAWRRDSLSAE
jgi:hypothetical protein